MKIQAPPQTRFCSAKAIENTSRPQPWASPMGCMNSPNVARTPMASSTTSVPRIRVRMEILSVWLDMKAVSLIESLLIVETPLLHGTARRLGPDRPGATMNMINKCGRRPGNILVAASSLAGSARRVRGFPPRRRAGAVKIRLRFGAWPSC